MTDADARRGELHAFLGDLPERDRPIHSEVVGEEEREHYVLQRLVLDLNGLERVPACFTRPRSGEGPWPAVLYNHAHGGEYAIGKEELLVGRSALQDPPYADLLAGLGYCALCIDTWAFGERRGKTEGEIFREMLWQGRVMWGMMVYDSLRAVDYLTLREDVDSDCLATLGLSMGSTMAWWTAALDERLKVCVDICCMTDFHALIEARGLDGHGVYYFVPGLLKGFTTADINALIAPRAHLCLAGVYDRLTPLVGLDRVDHALKEAYARLDVPDAWRLSRHECGHMETAAMRAEIVEFLREWL